jgi:hypothetical protein
MERCTTFSGQNKSSVPPDRKQSEKLSGFCADALVVSRENIQFLVVRLQRGKEALLKSLCEPQNWTFGGITGCGKTHHFCHL